jgi:hypothetical protein
MSPPKNTASFIAFLGQLLVDFPHLKLFLVTDNALYHGSATTQAALSLYPNRLLVLCYPRTARFSIPLSASGCISNTSSSPTNCIAL